MRIFIHNVDSYIGKVLVKELRRGDGGLNRIFGTALNAADAPSVVKRLASKDDPKKAKKMAETLQSCRLVVMDLFNSSMDDLLFAINALKVDPKSDPPKATGELEGDVIFVLVSSAMVWASTESQGSDGFLRDSDFEKRRPRPGSKYEQWKEAEDLMLKCFNREGSQVKGFVVAGGALYGEGEAAFSQMFKDAWRGIQEQKILSPGTNRVPTVHVRDLARLVRQISLSSDGINPLEAVPYFLAVDQPPAGEGVARKPPMQKELVQGVVDEVSMHYDVPIVSEDKFDFTEEEEILDLREQMAVDLMLEPSAIMMGEEYSSSCDPPGWLCKDGFLAHIRTIADEFCSGKKLRAVRILVGGPPSSGKSGLSKAVAEHFKVPILELEDQADDKCLQKMSEQLSSNICRYRGYVLDCGPVGFAQAEKLFRFDVEVPKSEEEEAPPEGEEGEPAAVKIERRLNEETCPTFVILTQAPPGLCKAKWQAKGGAPDVFEQRMQAYAASNLTADVHSLADFFQDVANIGVLNLPVAGMDEEDLVESARIYIESKGRPFNYLPSEEEIATEIREKRALKVEREAKAAAAASLKHDDHEAEKREEERRHAERLRIIAQHEAAQQKLQDLPLREYLMRYMVPNLTEGLIEVCKVLPDNPVDYLANFLEEHSEVSAEHKK